MSRLYHIFIFKSGYRVHVAKVQCTLYYIMSYIVATFYIVYVHCSTLYYIQNVDVATFYIVCSTL